MLSRIKQYMQLAKTANMAELALVVDAPPDAVRAMLSHWIRKGCVTRVKACLGQCGTKCAGCNPLLLERYDWVDV